MPRLSVSLIVGKNLFKKEIMGYNIKRWIGKELLMNLLDFTLKEYQMIDSRANTYFSYLYLIMGFTFAFFGAILSVFKDSLFPISDASNYLTFILVTLYLLPVVTYVLGLFFAYNSIIIFKAGLYLIRLEKNIFILQTREHVHDDYKMSPWNFEAKNKKSKFILPYGTMLMLYILLPIATLFFSFYELRTIKIIEPIGKICVYYIPVIFLIIYITFMISLITSMLDYNKKCCEERDKYKKESPSAS